MPIYQRFVQNVLQSPAGILRLNLSRKLLNSGMNFGVTVAAHLQAFCFRKYEVCRLKQQQQHIRCEGMGRALSQSCPRDFWKEAGKINDKVIQWLQEPLLL